MVKYTLEETKQILSEKQTELIALNKELKQNNLAVRETVGQKQHHIWVKERDNTENSINDLKEYISGLEEDIKNKQKQGGKRKSKKSKKSKRSRRGKKQIKKTKKYKKRSNKKRSNKK